MTASEGARRAQPRSGFVWLIVGVVVVLTLLIDATVRTGIVEALLLAPWPLLLLWLLWTCFASPHVLSDDRMVRVHNPLRTWTIPWGAVADLKLRGQVEVHLADGRKVEAWALTVKRQRVKRDIDPVEREFELLQDRCEEASPQTEAIVTKTWNWPEIGAFLALIVWCVIGIFVTR
ncbi:MAG: hypothetical protein QM607_12720 [Microbacterium sp.]